jgi:hypothetical protein
MVIRDNEKRADADSNFPICGKAIGYIPINFSFVLEK